LEHKIPYPEKKCPRCSNENLLDGPRGGLSQNVLCPKCMSEWNYGPFGYEEISPARTSLYKNVSIKLDQKICPVGCKPEEISPARTYQYRVVSSKLDLQICPVGCKPGCRGETYPCIDEIDKIIEQGNIAFMIHSEHVKEQLETLNYRIDITSHNGMPIGMYISEKGSKSVYERF